MQPSQVEVYLFSKSNFSTRNDFCSSRWTSPGLFAIMPQSSPVCYYCQQLAVLSATRVENWSALVAKDRIRTGSRLITIRCLPLQIPILGYISILHGILMIHSHNVCGTAYLTICQRQTAVMVIGYRQHQNDAFFLSPYRRINHWPRANQYNASRSTYR